MSERVTLPSGSPPAPASSGRRVLLTNDDGVDAPGLAALAIALQRAGHEVVVVAPDHDVSGCGTGIGGVRLDRSIEVHRVTVPGLDGPAFSLPGTPGLAVMAAALGAFGARPDLVVSGINAGANVGGAVVHSGTVGGAITAATFAIPALAISLAPPADGDEWAWGTAAGVGLAMVAWMLGDGRPATVNVNVPAVPTSALRGPCWATLADFGTFVLAAADASSDGPRAELRVEQPGAPQPGSDRALLADGFVTASALAVLGAHQAAEGLPPLPELR